MGVEVDDPRQEAREPQRPPRDRAEIVIAIASVVLVALAVLALVLGR